jgi:hypothetical protein
VGTPQSTLQRPTVKENVAEGCSAVDLCRQQDPDKCPIHSKCVPDWEQYHCNCDSGNDLYILIQSSIEIW